MKKTKDPLKSLAAEESAANAAYERAHAACVKASAAYEKASAVCDTVYAAYEKVRAARAAHDANLCDIKKRRAAIKEATK